MLCYASCFSFHGINPRIKHLYYWNSLEQQQKWGDLKQTPKPPKHYIAGFSRRGNPIGTIGRKTTHFDIFHQLQPICLIFSPSCCVCSPRFKLRLYARALFVHVFLWRSVGQPVCDASPTLVGASTIKVFSRSRLFLKTGIPSLDKSNPRKGLIFRDISYLRCIRIDTTVE